MNLDGIKKLLQISDVVLDKVEKSINNVMQGIIYKNRFNPRYSKKC